MEPLPKDLGLLLAEQFREQMNHLSAAVQLLTPVVQEKGGAQYDPYLAILHQSLYRMMRMIGNLEYLELPEEQAAPRVRTLDLAGLCREMARQVEPLAQQAGLRFSYEEETGSLITQGDADQLRRALLELISNAIRAAGKGGQTGLRLAVRGDRATLTVWDNGPGMSPAQPEAADPLHRTGGVGLGLPLARRVAEGHGGALVFEQREGRGSRAILSLPVRPPEESGMLRSPQMHTAANGGFSDVLTVLSDVLPYQAFLPGDLE
ncbi:sensor histidine kinase [Flavonifractor hominis]|uniref:histidine kinase n=1 Tax=Flavonifractor hominis TaxID=3133178 RepID=A0ABV1EQI7_9FIRM